jgi:hypothetical protein
VPQCSSVTLADQALPIPPAPRQRVCRDVRDNALLYARALKACVWCGGPDRDRKATRVTADVRSRHGWVACAPTWCSSSESPNRLRTLSSECRACPKLRLGLDRLLGLGLTIWRELRLTDRTYQMQRIPSSTSFAKAYLASRCCSRTCSGTNTNIAKWVAGSWLLPGAHATPQDSRDGFGGAAHGV